MYSVGNRVRFSLFGRSHGGCVGGILEGMPAGIRIDTGHIRKEMDLRRPSEGIGTPRKEEDDVIIAYGITDGITDGNPILITIPNRDTDGSRYLGFADTPRPGHADLPALLRFPDHDIRGGGQFSGRLTAAMVAAGAVAKQYLSLGDVRVNAFSRSIGGVEDTEERDGTQAEGSRMFATRACTRELDGLMRERILSAASEGDSVGGVVECMISGLRIGAGGIWFRALDAELARSVFGIPACKGIEFGAGFGLAGMKGSESNDAYRFDGPRIVKETNRSGGIAGGMCDGGPVVFRTVFKPTPSISRTQDTVDLRRGCNGTVRAEGRHDPCIVPRAVAVVEAMAALTVADQISV